MSNRTLIELNHDFCPRNEHLHPWAEAMQRYMKSGDESYLPQGVTLLGKRHHSEPEFTPPYRRKP